MRWSFRIGRVAGISIFVHITFLLLPLWFGFIHYKVRGSLADAGVGVLFILVLFGVVILHELGHALTARRFGIRTRDITLLPIGGVARLERLPEDPKQELLVALAGPAVNVCLAALLFAIVGASAQVEQLAQVGLPGSEFLIALLWVNVALAVFNLVPAFPMDGGRVLRALLAMRMSYVRATNLAAGVGQTLALVFAFAGLASIFFGHLGPISNPFLLLIGLFVWVGASQEAGLVQARSALGSVPVTQFMIREFRTLSPADSLALAAEHLLGGWQHDFPVTENGKVAGWLTRGALVHGLAQKGQNALVGEVMLQGVPTVSPEASSENVLARMRAEQAQTVFVVEDERLRGILTRENVQEFMLIRAALNGETLKPVPPVIQREAA